MSYRLYPDVITAAKIIDSYRRLCWFTQNSSPDIDNIYVSISGCLLYQKAAKNIGIENVFTCAENGVDWGSHDYARFFRSLPHYFIEEGNDLYRVNIRLMFDNFGKSDITEEQLKMVLRKALIIQGGYSDRLLSALQL